MSYSAAGHEQSLSAEIRRRNAVSLLLFLCVAFAFLLRFSLSLEVMNLAVHYTSEGGGYYEKLHFGTYAILLMLPVVLFTRPLVLRGEEIGLFKALAFYLIMMLALVLYLFAVGRAGSSGFIIDTYVTAAAAGLLMLALNADARRVLGNITLGMLLLSAAIAIGEATTQHRLLPYSLTELQFRPIGLSSHPLSLGALCATAVGFVATTRWRLWIRIAAILLLFVGCAASGARAALLLTGAEIMMLVVFVRWPRLSRRHERQAKFAAVLFMSSIGVAMVAVLFAAGFLSRFNNTLFDENFMARVTIYQVFTLVSWKDILFGMDGNTLLAIVNEKLHLPYIESTPVVIGLLFGVPIAILFAALILWIPFRLLRGAPLAAWVATITFLAAALSNNALSSKSPEMAILIVLLLAYRKPPASPQQERLPAPD